MNILDEIIKELPSYSKRRGDQENQVIVFDTSDK